jgi:hypothetical protein
VIFKNKCFLFPFCVSFLYRAGSVCCFFIYFANQYKSCVKIFSWSTLAVVLKNKSSPGPTTAVGSPEYLDCIVVTISYNHVWTCCNNILHRYSSTTNQENWRKFEWNFTHVSLWYIVSQGECRALTKLIHIICRSRECLMWWQALQHSLLFQCAISQHSILCSSLFFS